jgi:beta-lactamase regulating signal transducer with metallopeptidase domain
MNLSQTCAALVNPIDQHELIARLFFSCLELAVLAVVATFVLQICRPRTPRLNALVWALVLAKPLVTLVIGSPIHALQIALPANFLTMPTTEIALKPPALPGGEVPQRLTSLRPPAEPGARTPTLNAGIVATSTGATAGSPSSGSAAGPNHYENIAGRPSTTDNSSTTWPAGLHSPGPLLVLSIWLTGVATMLLRAAMVRRQLAQIFRGCQAPDRSTLELFSTIAASMQIRRTPQLRVTDAVESPALVGSWRPTILIPTWLAAQSSRHSPSAAADGTRSMPTTDAAADKMTNSCDSSRSALAWSLRHELTHWKHGDLWLICLRELAQAVFFFHPAAWWTGRQLELAIEIACDRAVIATDAEAADYAQRLYQILEAVRYHRRPALASGLFATRSQIARRLVMLVETPLRLRPHLSKPLAVGMTLLTAATMAVGIGLREESNAQDINIKPQPATASGDKNADQPDAKRQTGTATYHGIDLFVQRTAGKNNLNNTLPEELGQTLSRVQGVKQVVGGLLDTVNFRDANLMVVLLSGWPAHSPLFGWLKVQFGGRTLIAGDERKAIIGKGLAAKLGKQVGDKIELLGDEQFEIVGIYESPILFENNGLVVPLGELQRLMGRLGEVTGFTIVAEHPIDAKGLEDLRKRLEAVQPGLTATIVVEPTRESKQTAGTGANKSDQPDKK